MHWLKTFNRVAAGSLAILLSGCTTIKAPKTLFITFGAPAESFESDNKQIRSFLNKYTESFQRSNPDTKIVYLPYTSKQFFNEIEADSKLHLGPDLIVIINDYAGELLARNLTTTLPNEKYFNEIYNSKIKAAAKSNNGYAAAPWLIDTQIACFNKAKIDTSPTTIEDLEVLSASGKKIGLSSNFFELFWTAGTQGAISEFSSLGSRSASSATYPAIQTWLKWLQRAALYNNTSFHKDARKMIAQLKANELDWITCWGHQLEDLKKTMGNSLGVAALPNGTMSKAYPINIIYAFALGKNSSPTQRKMATQFIKTVVNTVAQKKVQLDDTGFLAANQNVSIPPESSKIQSAINTSYNEQHHSYSKEEPGIDRYWERHPQLGKALGDLIDGSLDVDEALKIITTPQTN